VNAPESRQIVIAGAGIAGLTAAIAFARRGFSVQIYEQAPELEEAGAGLQLSPNATRLLDSLGVLEFLRPAAVRPDRIEIRGAHSGKVIASIPLGDEAESRWGAPYLVAHRADLQGALAARAAREHNITLVTGARVTDAASHAHGVTVSIDRGGRIDEVSCLLLAGADGVRSSVRGLGHGARVASPSGYAAWRTTVRRDSRAGEALSDIMPGAAVTVFLHTRFHLVAYPIRSGTALNLVAITRSIEGMDRTAGAADPAALAEAMRGSTGPLASLPQDAAPWTLWPISVVDERIPWTGAQRVALIGDAAHAMTPFAAQGAAMAIEDAVTLAELVAARPDNISGALTSYEEIRRPRVKRVAARGRFNRFAWHAGFPLSFGRDIVLRLREKTLAADLDWLYGYDTRRAAASKETGVTSR
jgi:salicylate hydroxylase